MPFLFLPLLRFSRSTRLFAYFVLQRDYRPRAALLDVQRQQDLIEHFLASDETNNSG